jgi:hypothetical protein
MRSFGSWKRLTVGAVITAVVGLLIIQGYFNFMTDTYSLYISVADVLVRGSDYEVADRLYMPVLVCLYFWEIRYERTPMRLLRAGSQTRVLMREIRSAVILAAAFALLETVFLCLVGKKMLYFWCNWHRPNSIFYRYMKMGLQVDIRAVAAVYWVVMTVKGILTLTILNYISWFYNNPLLLIFLPVLASGVKWFLNFWGLSSNRGLCLSYVFWLRPGMLWKTVFASLLFVAVSLPVAGRLVQRKEMFAGKHGPGLF